MYLSLHQVAKLLNIKTTDYQQLFKKLEKSLPSLAFEIESVFDPQKANTNVVPGQIIAIEKVLASDHLSVCIIKIHKKDVPWFMDKLWIHIFAINIHAIWRVIHHGPQFSKYGGLNQQSLIGINIQF